MFPSETYKELCIENQKVLRGEYNDPQVGDWVYLQSVGRAVLVIGIDVGPDPDTLALCFDHDEIGHFENEDRTIIPLFQPRQLIEMLEDRGYDWLIESKALMGKDVRYEAVLFGLCSKADTKTKLRAEDPDPTTALLKVYLEVVKEE